MTRDDIIRMAREAGLDDMNKFKRGQTIHPLEHFAELVAEIEREACAKVCDDIDTEYNGEDVLATWCAQAIRARGEQ
jgi:hypothetical protein